MEKTTASTLPKTLRYATILNFPIPQTDLGRKTEENQLPDEEQIATVVSSNEPIVGDKRPRAEEDVKEEEQSPAPQQAPRLNSAVQQVPNDLNGNYHGNGNGTGMGMVQSQNQDLSSMGYDTLYIGDLQWVRSSLLLCI